MRPFPELTIWNMEVQRSRCIKDSIKPGQKVVIVDDLIATGGSVEAAIKLVEELGGIVVKVVFLMELAGLKGRERLKAMM